MHGRKNIKLQNLKFKPNAHSASFFCYMLQHSASRHLTFFPSQLQTLPPANLGHKDEKALPGYLQNSEFSVSLF